LGGIEPGGASHPFANMGIKKKKVEELERHVEKKFFALSLLTAVMVMMAVLLALLGNK
jgi:hypothetical protein